MAIITKKKNKKTYLYSQIRQGKKVYQYYLGRADEPRLKNFLEIYKSQKAIPSELRYLFWGVDPERISLRRNASYIIERVLDFGTLKAVEWLRLLYSTSRIIETLLTSRKISEKSRNFWLIYYGFESELENELKNSYF